MNEIDAKMKLIQTAQSQIGYKEEGKNITKYAKDFDTKYPTFYNTKKQGADWCDIFNDWNYVETFGEENAKKMLYQPSKSTGAGCKFSANFYKQNNAFYSTPEIGDQIFFFVGGEINHTGIVESVTNEQVITIEGNCSNQVKRQYHKKNASNIAGYGRPDWSVVADVTPDIKPIGDDKVMIEMSVLSFGSVGEEVKTLQRLLREFNYRGANSKTISIDGKFGSNTLFAVKQYQKDHNISQDGIVGKTTWTKILKG